MRRLAQRLLHQRQTVAASGAGRRWRGSFAAQILAFWLRPTAALCRVRDKAIVGHV